MKIAVNLIACIAAIFLLSAILPDQVKYDGIAVVLAAGALLWLFNLLLRPILKLITLPLNLITLGLFSLVLNTLLVMLADTLVPAISFGGFLPSLLLSLVVSILQLVLGKSFKEGKKK
jgi:putative membrane protein